MFGRKIIKLIKKTYWLITKYLIFNSTYSVFQKSNYCVFVYIHALVAITSVILQILAVFQAGHLANVTKSNSVIRKCIRISEEQWESDIMSFLRSL